MEKGDHTKESNTQIHPTLAVYLSGNFNDQPVNSSNATKHRCAYLEKLNKNKLQTTTIYGGYLQLLISGLHIGWGIWSLDFNEPWFRGVNAVFIFIMLSFYVGAIIGGIMAGCIINIWRKQAIYYLSGSIMVISSLITIIWSAQDIGILFGRMIAGLGHGLVYNVIVIHAGENSVKQARGIITSSINCFLWSSIFIGSVVVATVQMGESTTISSDRMIGIFSLAFSVFAIMYTMFWTEESVVYLLNHGKLGEALELLAKLRKETETSSSISDDFEEMRLMVNQDKEENQNIFKNNNEKPLVLMVLLKFLHVLTNNFLFNWIFMIVTAQLLSEDNRKMSPAILCSVRFAGSILHAFLADSLGRKIFLSLSCTLAGIALLVLEIMLITIADFYQISHWFVSALCIIFQFFVALGIDPIPHIMLSEAFATSKKNWSVVFVTICENAAQMFLIGVCFVDGVIIEATFHLFLFISVSLIMLLVVILFFFLPETRGLSLSETRDLFRKNNAKCCIRIRYRHK